MHLKRLISLVLFSFLFNFSSFAELVPHPVTNNAIDVDFEQKNGEETLLYEAKISNIYKGGLEVGEEVDEVKVGERVYGWFKFVIPIGITHDENFEIVVYKDSKEYYRKSIVLNLIKHNINANKWGVPGFRYYSYVTARTEANYEITVEHKVHGVVFSKSIIAVNADENSQDVY